MVTIKIKWCRWSSQPPLITLTSHWKRQHHSLQQLAVAFYTSSSIPFCQDPQSKTRSLAGSDSDRLGQNPKKENTQICILITSGKGSAVAFLSFFLFLLLPPLPSSSRSSSIIPHRPPCDLRSYGPGWSCSQLRFFSFFPLLVLRRVLQQKEKKPWPAIQSSWGSLTR